jgi:hypothetical protein
MNIDDASAEWLLERLPPGVSVADFHGTLTGLLCAAGDREADRASLPRDLAKLLGTAVEHLPGELFDIAADAAAALDSPELTFDPWLPDEDAPLPARLAALADWCSAFVSAFERSEAVLDDESEEALADLGAIAEIDADTASGDEAMDDDEAEFDLNAITEHVRIAVLMLHAAARPDDDDGVG